MLATVESNDVAILRNRSPVVEQFRHSDDHCLSNPTIYLGNADEILQAVTEEKNSQSTHMRKPSQSGEIFPSNERQEAH